MKTVLMALFLTGCTASGTVADLNVRARQRVDAAEAVARTVCVLRETHPVVREVIHAAVANSVPGGELGHEAVQIGCTVVLEGR